MLPIQIPNSSVVKNTVKAALKDNLLSASIAANIPLFNNKPFKRNLANRFFG